MSHSHINFFITPQELSQKLNDQKVKILDGSWYLPTSGREGKTEFEACHIKGARFFDIDLVSDTSSPLPHMLPEAAAFEEAARNLGINNDDLIVVYGGQEALSSARVWWTFRTFGAKHVKILQGGLEGWKILNLATESGPANLSETGNFSSVFANEKVRNIDYMKDNIKKGDTLVLDARPFARYTGEATEPRKGLRSGHIPGSKSLPALDIYHNEALIDLEQIACELRILGVENADHITTSCGSGVTAAILTLALESLGYSNHSLYDGSWSEWGAQDDAPIAQWK